MKTALVIDDHPITHLGCRRLLEEAQYELILDARNDEDACRLASRHEPGLIVLDLGLPGGGGLNLIRPLKQRVPDARILVFSMNDGTVFAARALEAGAQGFLSKNSLPEEFLKAVRTLNEGRVYLDHDMATALAMLKTGREQDPLAAISSREHQVLRLIAQGKSYSEISADIHVSYKTVANTCANLKKKLGAKSLSDLIRISLEQTQA